MVAIGLGIAAVTTAFALAILRKSRN